RVAAASRVSLALDFSPVLSIPEHPKGLFTTCLIYTSRRGRFQASNGSGRENSRRAGEATGRTLAAPWTSLHDARKTGADGPDAVRRHGESLARGQGIMSL